MKNYKSISEKHKKMSYIWLAIILVSLVVFVALQIWVSTWFLIGVILINWPANYFHYRHIKKWRANNEEWGRAIKAGLCDFKYNDEYIPIINRFIDRCFYADDLETYEVLSVKN